MSILGNIVKLLGELLELVEVGDVQAIDGFIVIGSKLDGGLGARSPFIGAALNLDK